MIISSLGKSQLPDFCLLVEVVDAMLFQYNGKRKKGNDDDVCFLESCKKLPAHLLYLINQCHSDKKGKNGLQENLN